MTKALQTTATAEQIDIVRKRIADCIYVRVPDHITALGQLITGEDWQRVRRMVWDEYQLNIEPMDSIKDIAWMLQQKLKTNNHYQPQKTA